MGGVVAEENGITKEGDTITEDITLEESETIGENEILEEDVVADEIANNVLEMSLEEDKGTEDKMYQERVAESELVVDEQEGNKSIIFDAATKTYFMGDYAMQDYINGGVDLATLQSGKYDQNTKIIVNGEVTFYTINGEVSVNSIRKGDKRTYLNIFKGSDLKVETNDVIGIDILNITVGYTPYNSEETDELAKVTKLQVKAKEIGILTEQFIYVYMDLVIEAEKFGITLSRFKENLLEPHAGRMDSGKSSDDISKMKITVTGDDAIGIQMREIFMRNPVALEVNVKKGIGIYTYRMNHSPTRKDGYQAGYLKVSVGQGEGIVGLETIYISDASMDIQVEDGIGINVFHTDLHVVVPKMKVEVQHGYAIYGLLADMQVGELRIVTGGASDFSKQLLETRIAQQDALMGTSHDLEVPSVAAMAVGSAIFSVYWDDYPRDVGDIEESWLISAPKDFEGSYGMYGMVDHSMLYVKDNAPHNESGIPSVLRIEGNIGVFLNNGGLNLIGAGRVTPSHDTGELATLAIESKKGGVDVASINVYSYDSKPIQLNVKSEGFGIKTETLMMTAAIVNIEVLGDNAQTAFEVRKEKFVDIRTSEININTSGDGLIIDAGNGTINCSDITVQADGQPIEMNFKYLDEIHLNGTKIVAIANKKSPDIMDVPAFNTEDKIFLASDTYVSVVGGAKYKEGSLVEIYKHKTGIKLSEEPTLVYSTNGNIDNYLDYEWKASPEISFEVTEEKVENVVFTATRQGSASLLRETKKIQLQDKDSKHVVGVLTGTEVPENPENPETPEGGDSSLYTVNFYNCAGKLESQDWVALGETARAPKTYTYPTSAMENINSNRDIQPLNCDSQFTIPNTGIR